MVVWIHSNTRSRATEMCLMWTALGIMKPSAGAQSARVSLLAQVPNNILPQAVLQLVVPKSLVPNYWVHVMSGYAAKISWLSASIRFQIYRMVPRTDISVRINPIAIILNIYEYTCSHFKLLAMT